MRMKKKIVGKRGTVLFVCSTSSVAKYVKRRIIESFYYNINLYLILKYLGKFPEENLASDGYASTAPVSRIIWIKILRDLKTTI
jgi:hypothetical protein